MYNDTATAGVPLLGTGDTWLSRLQEAIGPSGYDSSHRRSVQTVVLYEANRCIADALPHLRPFQRKVAYIDMANALLDSINFIPPHQRLEIFWRTGTSKEPMNADTAWKRRKLLTKDIERIKDAVTDRAATSGLSHEDAIDSYLQNELETSPGGSVTATIKAWSQAHNNAIMCYRMYYRGATLDPTFPPPNPPKPIRIVTDKHLGSPTAPYYYPQGQSQPLPTTSAPPPPVPVHPAAAAVAATAAAAATTAKAQPAILDIHDRGRLLEEVKEHLELLKQFEGIIPDEEIASRKRELFLALPLPPPPAAKRSKKDDELLTL
ncbi:hypothetical protein MHU86_17051 [Fragilaria crotonensis]|nr:hypothetical protein MHU86_17051 [Fragilaria crotonensis]